MFIDDAQLLAEAWENLYSGKTDDEKEEKDDKEEKDSSEKSDDSDDSSEKETNDEEEKDSDKSDDSGSSEDEDGGKEDSDEDSEDSDSGSSSGGQIKGKIKSLQKQYNKILIDAFTKYAPECIEKALNSGESTFGADIEQILSSALDELKGKILDDLGIEPTMEIGGMEISTGEPDVTFGSKVGGVPTMSVNGGDEDTGEESGDEGEKAEDEDSDGEEKKDKEDKDDDDKEVTTESFMKVALRYLQ